jgi:phage terminase small subunit
MAKKRRALKPDRKLMKIGKSLPNPKRELFVQLYVADPDTWGNASASWRKAGYAARSSQQESSKVLSDPVVQDRIRELRVWHEAQVEVNAEWMHDRLSWLSRYNVDDVLQRCSVLRMTDDDGNFLPEPVWTVDLSRVPREISYCVEEVSYDSQGRPRIKMISKLKAIELLGKLTKVKAFAEDEKLSEEQDIAVMILKARARRRDDTGE